jgi:hypothetical protein
MRQAPMSIIRVTTYTSLSNKLGPTPNTTEPKSRHVHYHFVNNDSGGLGCWFQPASPHRM